MTCAVLSAPWCSTNFLMCTLEEVAILTSTFMHIPIHSPLCLLSFTFRFCCEFYTALNIQFNIQT